MSLTFAAGTPMWADPVSDYGGGNIGQTRLTAGDVNNDGYPDIVAAHGYRTAGLYLNRGDQTFAAEDVLSESWWHIEENTGATSVALGDLDLDGNLDLVIPIYGDHYRGHMVQLYRGLGDGSFELWPVDGYNASLNFEGEDGVDDGIIVASGAANPMFPLIADFNGDGLPDVAVSGNNGAWSVDVLIQSASHGFSVSDSDGAGQNPQYLAVGDFNEDGYPDVVAGALYNGVLVFLNDADANGGLHRVGGTYLSRNHQYVATGDFNGDGHVDIAARGNLDARVYLLSGDGTGSFSTTTNFATSGVDGYLATADINNDGHSDLVVASRSTHSVDLLLNDGIGGFGAPESIALDAAPWGIVVDDFDLDGWTDIAVSRDDDTVQILWNQGSTSVTPASFSLAENSPPGTEVGTVTATGGPPLTFAITAGNSDVDSDGNLAFAIDTAGTITVNDSGDLDHETTPTFALTIVVTDAGGLSDAATVTIDVVDVFELEGTAGNDVLTGTSGSDLLDGLAGDDKLSGGLGDDRLIGGPGIDVIREQGDVDLHLSDDHLTGLGNDILVSIERANLAGGTGGNTLDASGFTRGRVILDGGAGDDTLIGSASTGNVLIGGQGNDSLTGGGALDRVRARGDIDFTLTDSQLTGLGTDRLTSIEQAKLIGGASDNRIDVSAFTGTRTVLVGGGGDDTLVGRKGDGIDKVGSHGNFNLTLTDSQLSGEGTDKLVAIDGAFLAGGADGNTLDASAFTRGRVSLDGDAGDDILKGGTGNDVLNGGAGDDALFGGLGTDGVKGKGDTDWTLTDTQLIGLGTDTLDNIEWAFLIGGPGHNVLDASSFAGTMAFLVGSGGDDSLIGRADGIDVVRARGDFDFELTDNELRGLGTDSLVDIDRAELTGDSGANAFDASAYTVGKVYIAAGGGDDTLLGGTAKDRLDGGLGNDMIDGGLGRDSLSGGLGADTFRFKSVAEAALGDVIRDFDLADGDRIDLSAVDADVTVAGDQTFDTFSQADVFSGTFSSAAALFFERSTQTLFGNVDGESEADFSIRLVGIDNLTDFLS